MVGLLSPLWNPVTYRSTVSALSGVSEADDPMQLLASRDEGAPGGSRSDRNRSSRSGNSSSTFVGSACARTFRSGPSRAGIDSGRVRKRVEAGAGGAEQRFAFADCTWKQPVPYVWEHAIPERRYSLARVRARLTAPQQIRARLAGRAARAARRPRSADRSAARAVPTSDRPQERMTAR